MKGEKMAEKTLWMSMMIISLNRKEVLNEKNV
jgi:hypothetical protein